MDYGQIYSDLIERGLARTLGEGVYFEKHHVWPKCMGGPDEASNLVKLTPEEHYLAHQLLVKMFPDNNKLVYAASMMSLNSNGNRPNNKLYGWLRKKHIEAQKGTKLSEEAKQKLSNFNKGKKLSEETKRKISEANKGRGREQSPEIRRKISETLKGKIGKPHSEEAKRKMSESLKGKTPWNKGKSKVSEHIQEIKNRRKEGESYKMIAARFEISEALVSKIINR